MATHRAKLHIEDHFELALAHTVAIHDDVRRRLAVALKESSRQVSLPHSAALTYALERFDLLDEHLADR